MSHDLDPSLETDTSSLRVLAKLIDESPIHRDSYDYAKSVLLGSPDRTSRLAGDHPWPTRTHGEQEYVYTVPVLAGVSPERGTLLFIGKDNWQPDEDPNAWLVSIVDLKTGKGFDHRILQSSVDAGRRVRLQLAPLNYDSMPPLDRGAVVRQPPYDQMAITGYLDKLYHLETATVKERMGKPVIEYQDYGVFDQMVEEVAREREALLPGQHRAYPQEAGERAVSAALAGV